MEPKALEPVLADLIKKMGDAAQHYGPGAIKLTAEYLQVKAFIDIGIGVALLAIAFLAWKVATTLGRPALAEARKDILKQDDGITFGFGIPAVFLCVSAAILVFAACTYLLDSGTWIAAINPQLALVQIALKAVP